MTGFQVLEQLVGDPRLRDLPVIVTSSLEGVAHVVRCIELGADDYLPKPVNPVLLKARIDASLEKKRLRDQQKELVRRFATSEVAQDMQQSGFALGGRHLRGSVMFADIRGFTSLVESQPPEESIELLNTWYTLMFDAISGHGGVVNQMIGDGLMAIFGAPLPLDDHAARGRAGSARHDRDDRAAQRRAHRSGQGGAAHRHRHRDRRDGRRLHRHAAARDLHLHRRHREPRGAPRVAHQGRAARHPDRRRDAGWARSGLRGRRRSGRWPSRARPRRSRCTRS